MTKHAFLPFVSFFFLVFAAVSFSLPYPVLALEGTAGGPCMPPHDTPTVGSYNGGNATTQTYQAPAGKKVKRICAATRWSTGKIDHSSHYKDYSDECYQISGIGTTTVTVKKVAETYYVPEWQTGTEAGKCHDLVHLDIFLSDTAPTPINTPSPTPQPGSNSTTNTTSPTATPNANATSTPSPVGALLGLDSEGNTTDESSVSGEVLGASQATKPAKIVEASQAAEASSDTASMLRYWWLGALALIVVGVWFIWRKLTSDDSEED